MSSDDMTGGQAIAIWHRSLDWSVRELLQRLTTDQLHHLKVRSGEHLAAILITAFLRRAPSKVDDAGGVDLLFDFAGAGNVPSLLHSDALHAAFEVKSLPGPYRAVDAEIDRLIRAGGDATGLGVTVKVESAATILSDAEPLLARTQARLLAKNDGLSSNHAFLVVHPFDRFAIECYKSPIIGPALPPLTPLPQLDTVWVLFVPDHLVVWSTSSQAWTDLFFTAVDPREEPDGPPSELALLQEAESGFLSGIGSSDGSPYLFGLSGGH